MAQMKCELMSALLEYNSLSHAVRALAYSERFIIRFMGGTMLSHPFAKSD